jgi:hypothetical protein
MSSDARQADFPEWATQAEPRPTIYRPPPTAAEKAAARLAARKEQEHYDRLRADFARDFRVREYRWTARNVNRLLAGTGEPPEQVKWMRAILAELGGATGPHWPVFDHGTLWGRQRVPLILVGDPYDIEPRKAELLAELGRASTRLRVTVDDRPSFYYSRTHHVRVEVLVGY